MSEPCREAELVEFREIAHEECRSWYKKEYGKFPSNDELEIWFQELLDSDLRQGEE